MRSAPVRSCGEAALAPFLAHHHQGLTLAAAGYADRELGPLDTAEDDRLDDLPRDNRASRVRQFISNRARWTAVSTAMPCLLSRNCAGVAQPVTTSAPKGSQRLNDFIMIHSSPCAGCSFPRVSYLLMTAGTAHRTSSTS
jgi:hypothetical protein